MEDLTIETERWPLEGMKISTLLKVVGIDLYYHSYKGYSEPHGEPYTQISIHGFVLLGMEGCVLHADVEINEEYGFTDKVRAIKEQFAPGSIHWIESESFYSDGRSIQFYNSKFKPVDSNNYCSANTYFPANQRGQPLTRDKSKERGSNQAEKK